ncbi:hypothetical protein N7468_008324 [Penicillium chermesinum]|uniref:Uncharacterized protein n=1 Tax=Penicillium chermesinum TaxID=63820 RepID=A0A9W9NPK1_9EURO|nr:uncharacterized protein N7468_008324 [Penicillium chermesinum]KAJ5223782.1 hypothetical protein N7468_008324 [Penicillium chermesinum]KAJ6155392.1 hypothetical protein N7470_005958 [Penicillium chermesinum]
MALGSLSKQALYRRMTGTLAILSAPGFVVVLRRHGDAMWLRFSMTPELQDVSSVAPKSFRPEIIRNQVLAPV